jgi:hypothetical protein
MSFQVMLQCDIKSKGPKGYSGPPFCYTLRADDPAHPSAAEKPSAISDNQQPQIVRASQWVADHARKHGWVKVPSGWACPNCKTMLHRK